jgi:hypothetical protein
MEVTMPTFLITYHGGGGGMPPTPEAREQMMSAFQAWAASVGDKMVDPGAPLGPSRVVTSGGYKDGKVSEVDGYSVITADSLDAAVEAVRSHPFVARGGSLQVSEAVAP